MILDGKELAAAMGEHNIYLTDSEVDSTLSILNNHGRFGIISRECFANFFIVQMTQWIFTSFAIW